MSATTAWAPFCSWTTKQTKLLNIKSNQPDEVSVVKTGGRAGAQENTSQGKGGHDLYLG